MKDELAEICLGSYDCASEEFVVYLGLHNQERNLDVTFTHEFMHHYLNDISSFGLLMRRVAQDIKRGKGKGLLSSLCDKCRDVHEMLATYYSLSENESQKLVHKMPNTYQKWYERMRKIVEPVFSNVYMRCRFAVSVARLAMMTGSYFACAQNNNYSDEFIKHELNREEGPNVRIKRIEGILEQIGPTGVANRLTSFSESILGQACKIRKSADLIERFDENMDNIISFENNVGLCIFQALVELLVEHFPQVDDNYAKWRLYGMTFSPAHGIPRALRYNGMKVKSPLYLVQAARACKQRISLFPKAHVEYRVIADEERNLPELKAIIDSSVKKTGVLFPFVEMGPERKDVELYLTDTQKGQVVAYSVKGYSTREALQMVPKDYGVPTITLIQEPDFFHTIQKKMELPAIIRFLLFDTGVIKVTGTGVITSCAFVYLVNSPIDFLERAIRSGTHVDWLSLKVGYEQGLIDEKKGLQIAFYWWKGLPVTFFHFSNKLMTDGIIHYTKFINDQDKVRFESHTSESVRRKTLTFSKFLDHPVLNFYYCGKNPQFAKFSGK